MSGLKIQITFTLFVLMAIALILGNLVIFMFWQRAMVHSEIEHVEAVLDNAAVFRESRSQELSWDIEKKLDNICFSAGKRCVDSVYYDGTTLHGNRFRDLYEKLERVAKTAAVSGERVIELDGSMWRVLFSPKRRHLVVAEPLLGEGGVAESAVLVLELDSIYEIIKEDQKIILVYLFVNILLLSIIGLFRMIKLIVKPIDRIVEITDAYQTMDNLFFTAGRSSSEFGRLNMALNNMLMRIEKDKSTLRETINSLENANEELRKAHQEMVRTEKLASVGRLSAGLAHEIGNPIGIIHGYIELLRQDSLSVENRQQFSQRSLAELERINSLIRQLLDYAGTSSAEFEQIDVNEDFVNTVIDLVSLQNKSDNVVMETKLEPELAIQGNREGLQQVLLNCVLNAMDAVHERGQSFNGKILLTAERIGVSDTKQKPEVEISIIDNGIGIEEADIDSLFDPFYTTKEPGKGTGLGLFVSHSIIEAHGGTMVLENNQVEGATVKIILPLVISEIENG